MLTQKQIFLFSRDPVSEFHSVLRTALFLGKTSSESFEMEITKRKSTKAVGLKRQRDSGIKNNNTKSKTSETIKNRLEVTIMLIIPIVIRLLSRKLTLAQKNILSLKSMDLSQAAQTGNGFSTQYTHACKYVHRQYYYYYLT